jgi:hypothetical protein
MGYILSDKILIMESLLSSFQGYLLFLMEPFLFFKKEGTLDNFITTIP